MSLYVCTCVYIYIYIYIHTHTYTHTYIERYAYIKGPCSAWCTRRRRSSTWRPTARRWRRMYMYVRVLLPFQQPMFQRIASKCLVGWKHVVSLCVSSEIVKCMLLKRLSDHPATKRGRFYINMYTSLSLSLYIYIYIYIYVHIYIYIGIYLSMK